MKAPDKIYRRIEGKFIRYYDHKPAKTRYDEPNPDEYIHKDVLLEWAQRFWEADAEISPITLIDKINSL